MQKEAHVDWCFSLFRRLHGQVWLTNGNGKLCDSAELGAVSPGEVSSFLATTEYMSCGVANATEHSCRNGELSHSNSNQCQGLIATQRKFMET